MSFDAGFRCRKLGDESAKDDVPEASADALRSVELALSGADYVYARQSAGIRAERHLRTARLQAVNASLRMIRRESWHLFDAWRTCAADKGDYSGLGDPVLALLRIWLWLALLQVAAWWTIGLGLPMPAAGRLLRGSRAAMASMDGDCRCP